MIRGGRIIDGSGNPWFLGDIGVRDGRIARIGRQLSGSAGRAVDATGKVVAPGFIDVHTHIEGDIEKRPGAENFVRMGVTTVVTGNCGGSALPLGPWLDRLERDPSAINVASLVGHNIVRRAGMSGTSTGLRPMTNWRGCARSSPTPCATAPSASRAASSTSRGCTRRRRSWRRSHARAPARAGST